MRIAFSECDRMPGDLFRCHDYDCYLNGKLFDKNWCIADEEKGEIQIFKRDESDMTMRNENRTEFLRETFTGIVELKLKQTRETR